jgi:hypothetical protein
MRFHERACQKNRRQIDRSALVECVFLGALGASFSCRRVTHIVRLGMHPARASIAAFVGEPNVPCQAAICCWRTEGGLEYLRFSHGGASARLDPTA